MTTWKFLSPEWIAEVKKIVQERITPEAVNYATTSVLTIFENCTDGVEKALITQINKGVFDKIALQEKPYPQTEFTISGEYATFIKVFKGQIKPTVALMTGELKLKGNMFRAMGMVSVLEPFYKALAEIPSDF